VFCRQTPFLQETSKSHGAPFPRECSYYYGLSATDIAYRLDVVVNCSPIAEILHFQPTTACYNAICYYEQFVDINLYRVTRDICSAHTSKRMRPKECTSRGSSSY
jgi:hypothetical protein